MVVKSYRKRKPRRKGRKYYAPPPTHGPLATKMTSRMIYQDLITVNPGIGSVGVHMFRANSLYDPDFTGIGHQPRGFDQIMTMYDHFTVIGAKIKVRVSSTLAENKGNYCIFIHLSDSQILVGTPNDYAESFYTKRILWSQRSDDTVLTYSCDPNRYLGRSHPLSDPEVKGSVVANPAEMAFFHVGAFAQNAGSDLGAVDLDVQIEFLSVFTEPNQPSQS